MAKHEMKRIFRRYEGGVPFIEGYKKYRIVEIASAISDEPSGKYIDYMITFRQIRDDKK